VLIETLESHGHSVEAYHAMQFMELLITNLSETLAADGTDPVNRHPDLFAL